MRLDTTPKSKTTIVEPIWSPERIDRELFSCTGVTGTLLWLPVQALMEQIASDYNKEIASLHSRNDELVDYAVAVDRELEIARRRIPHTIYPQPKMTFQEAAAAVAAEFGPTWNKWGDQTDKEQ